MQSIIRGERSEMMLAHDIAGKKEDEDYRETVQVSIKMYWCEMYGVVC